MSLKRRTRSEAYCVKYRYSIPDTRYPITQHVTPNKKGTNMTDETLPTPAVVHIDVWSDYA